MVPVIRNLVQCARFLWIGCSFCCTGPELLPNSPHVRLISIATAVSRIHRISRKQKCWLVLAKARGRGAARPAWKQFIWANRRDRSNAISACEADYSSGAAQAGTGERPI